MTDPNEYTRVAPVPVWPPDLGALDPDQGRTTTPVPPAVYEFLKDPADRAPLTSPYASRADEVAAYHAADE